MILINSADLFLKTHFYLGILSLIKMSSEAVFLIVITKQILRRISGFLDSRVLKHLDSQLRQMGQPFNGTR